MEAGSKKENIEGENFISGRRIFVSLPKANYLLINFLASIFTLISFMKKGILKSVFFGFVFLFLCVNKSTSSFLIGFSHRFTSFLNVFTHLFTDQASNAMCAGSSEIKSCLSRIPDIFLLPAYSSLTHLYDTPGFTAVEAPSSRLCFPGFIASTSCMLNQNLSL